MTDVTRYPLSWPFGWRRTAARQRQRATFSESKTIQMPEGQPAIRKEGLVSMPRARDRLQRQLELLGAKNALVSTNIELTIYGQPRAGRRDPDDPGVAVYFQLGGKDRVLACDRWDQVQGNIAAIAAHIDAIRRVDRYGVGTLEQAFAGYDALPAPGADNRPSWRKVLGLDERTPVSVPDIEAAYRSEAKRLHPDKPGGSHDAMAQLNHARDAALRELGL